MKKIKKSLILLPVFAFLAAYNSVPADITVTQGQKAEFIWGSIAGENTQTTGNFEYQAKLFNVVPIKTVNVSVAPQAYVIPSGEAIGVKLHTDGVLAVGTGEVTDENGIKRRPAEKAGITAGDRIISVNGKKITDTASFSKLIRESGGTANLELIRGNETVGISVQTAYSSANGGYMLGLWVKDSAAGIGTMTFYNPSNGTFAALGHAICDSDTETILAVGDGVVSPCEVNGCYKGQRGKPGELLGVFSDKITGKITKNCAIGIYGNTTKIPDNQPIPVAARFQIKQGSAVLMCDADGNGVQTYNVEIIKISRSPNVSNKCFVIKVKDERLIEKTGGIVQGMSGSPIIQDGMLVGAVTHVCVNL